VNNYNDGIQEKNEAEEQAFMKGRIIKNQERSERLVGVARDREDGEDWPADRDEQEKQ